MSLLGIWIGLTIVIYLGNWLLPQRGGFWTVAAAWAAMCVYAWKVTDVERVRRSESKRGKNGKPLA